MGETVFIMNKKRRNELQLIINELEILKERLVQVKEEEEEAYDNMPTSLQESERGEIIYENISSLDDIFESMQESIDSMQEIIDN